MMLLCAQAQLQGDRNALSRPAFARMAHDERCQLYFPLHGDQVASLSSASVHMNMPNISQDGRTP